MEGYVYRRDLLTASDLRDFSQKSDSAGMRRLAIHLLMIAAGGTLVLWSVGSWWAWPGYVLHGVILGFIFAPLHESIHNTAFRSRRLNSAVSAVAGFLLILPANYFRLFHYAHHRYTNHEEDDPELSAAKPATVGAYIWAMTGFPSYWWPQLKLLFYHAAGRVTVPFVTQSDRERVVAEARLHVAAYLALAAGSYFAGTAVLLHVWILPLLFGMVALRGFLLAEHAGCELSGNMLRNTRTTISNPLIRFLSWNMPYHVEHHVFPSVPFHRLPSLHQRLKDRESYLSKGYIQFHRDFVRSLT